jgi:hypothetical protein
MEPRIRLLASTRLEPQSGSQRGGRVAEEHTNVSKFEDLGMDDYRNTSPEAESCESEDSDDDADEPSDSSEESSDDIQGISSTSSENKTCPNTKSEHVSSILEAQLYVLLNHLYWEFDTQLVDHPTVLVSSLATMTVRFPSTSSTPIS